MVTRNQLIVGIVAAVVVTAVVVAAVMFFTLRVRGSGRIVTIGLEAYADVNCTTLVDAIDWGDISPGGSSAATIYLKSTSSVPVNLTLAVENWSPAAAADYMTVEWSYDGSALEPGEIRSVTIGLLVAEDITGVSKFEHDLVITAAG